MQEQISKHRSRQRWLLAAATLVLVGGVSTQPAVGRPQSQDSTSQAAETVVPRLVRFNGAVRDSAGKPATGEVTLTFALYEEQEGGNPLWTEAQKLQLDDQGQYTALLGATQPDGLPLDLFTSGRARWLGVMPQLAGVGELPRVLLVGMPYALKAADAETLGGKPASAYMLAEGQSGGNSSGASAVGTTADAKARADKGPAIGFKDVGLACALGGAGLASQLALFNAPCNLVGANVTQVGRNIGINLGPAVLPRSLLEVQLNAAGVLGPSVTITNGGIGVNTASSLDFNTFPVAVGQQPTARIEALDDGHFSSNISFLTKNQGAAGNPDAERMRITSTGYVGIGTSSPGSLLTVSGNVQVDYANANKGGGTPGVQFGLGNSGESIASDRSGTVNVNGLDFYTDFTSRISITNAGAVGISTQTPASQLDINNPGGTDIIIGRNNGTKEFRVDGTGKGFFDGGTQTGGADFAESVAVRGSRSQYHVGDLLAIDGRSKRRLALADKPYSRLVAGIYSTKPGVLATPHKMGDSALEQEVPLAIVGIVPCKVTTANGSIRPGDLLVTSSRPGFAMKGTDQNRMLGAVVGKALEPLTTGTGTIQVLVTLQ